MENPMWKYLRFSFSINVTCTAVDYYPVVSQLHITIFGNKVTIVNFILVELVFVISQPNALPICGNEIDSFSFIYVKKSLVYKSNLL
jgi:hypothetical protein